MGREWTPSRSSRCPAAVSLRLPQPPVRSAVRLGRRVRAAGGRRPVQVFGEANAAVHMVTRHFTPTSGSWLNIVPVNRDLLRHHHPPDHRRGTFASVKDLTAAIGNLIDGWNERCQPFTRTKTADELLPHCKPGKRPSLTLESKINTVPQRASSAIHQPTCLGKHH